jgi:hypothetical protein
MAAAGAELHSHHEPIVVPELDYPDVSGNFVVMAGLDPAIQS